MCVNHILIFLFCPSTWACHSGHCLAAQYTTHGLCGGVQVICSSLSSEDTVGWDLGICMFKHPEWLWYTLLYKLCLQPKANSDPTLSRKHSLTVTSHYDFFILWSTITLTVSFILAYIVPELCNYTYFIDTVLIPPMRRHAL